MGNFGSHEEEEASDDEDSPRERWVLDQRPPRKYPCWPEIKFPDKDMVPADMHDWWESLVNSRLVADEKEGEVEFGTIIRHLNAVLDVVEELMERNRSTYPFIIYAKHLLYMYPIKTVRVVSCFFDSLDPFDVLREYWNTLLTLERQEKLRWHDQLHFYLDLSMRPPSEGLLRDRMFQCLQLAATAAMANEWHFIKYAKEIAESLRDEQRSLRASPETIKDLEDLVTKIDHLLQNNMLPSDASLY